ncbi:MAG: O-antigen translocase [Flavobacteriales bacterium]|nr:O-antigen translocase [Flavobacteriales bacterium]
MKATSIFGGVQVFNIIIQLIRSKVVAVLLGPTGMGIMGLLQTTVSLVSSATNLGLGTSAVRDISEANTSNDSNRVGSTVAVMRKLVWVTGLVGMIVTIALSPLLSKLTFGNYDYTVGFVVLSVTLLLNQLTSGQGVILQGLRQLTWLAKANVYGSVCGLLISLPLYYLYGPDGIVPAIVLSALALLGIQYAFAKQVKITALRISFKEALYQGKGMMKLGFMLSLSGLITVAASYLVRIYISHTGGVADVGLYSAGFAIIGTYVGLVFSAMGTDYYPRLASVSQSNEESKTVINQQAEIAILIMAPIIMIFLVFIKWVVVLLYSQQFAPVNDMILYAALGMFFKAASWAVTFLFLAKGAGKLFFWNELLTNIYLTLLNVVGYKYWGLTGLGISFLISYILYFVQVYLITLFKYEFSFSKEFIKVFSMNLLLGIFCLLTVKMLQNPYSYLFGLLFIFLSLYISFRELDKRLQLKELFNRIKK